MKALHLLCSWVIMTLVFTGIALAGSAIPNDPFTPTDDPCRFPYLPGWPVQAGGPWGVAVACEQPPIPVNFDPSDPEKELILCLDHRVYAWQHDGTLMTGWPVDHGADGVYRGPAIIMDRNQGIAAFSGSTPNYGHVHLYNHQGRPVPNWPVVFTDYIYKSPVWADLNHDSIPELIDKFQGSLNAWTTTGGPNLLPGFPVVFAQPITGLAVGDVNDDGALEIVCASMMEPTTRWVRVVSSTGQILSAWQPTGPYMQTSAASPALADLDNNGDLEIILGGAGVLWVWHHDGTPHWPTTILGGYWTSSVAVGDLEGDGDLEVAVNSWNTAYLFNADGSNHAGHWPIYRENMSFTWGDYELAGPVIGDLDGDGIQEICFKAMVVSPPNVLIVALEPNGSTVTGFPIRQWASGDLQPSPAIMDLDGDGEVDLCSAGQILSFSQFDSVRVAVWDLGTPYNPNRMDWPMVDHDPQRTGCLPSAYSRAARLAATPNTALPGDLHTLKISPNPFNPTTTISYELRAAGHVNLQVYDTAGRLVATLADGWMKAGDHQASFNASNLPSGVYLFKLQADDGTTSGKMVLAK